MKLKRTKHYQSHLMGKKPNKLFGQPSMYVCTYINKCAQILTLVLLDKEYRRALAGVAQWIERRPVNQRVAGAIPSQGTCLGCGPGPQWGVCERQPHIDVFLPLFYSL